MTNITEVTTIQMHVLDQSGQTRTVEGEISISLMQIMRTAGIDEIRAFCGGCCSCATCHVYVDPAFLAGLPAISESEDELLDTSAHRAGGSRLSCQIPASASLAGIKLTIAPQD
jgi:2Fe-2S ferredoxin